MIVPQLTGMIRSVSEAPLVEVPPAPRHCTVQELLSPDDPLRKSVEAFLLDQRSQHTRRAYGKDLRRFLGFLATIRGNQAGAFTPQQIDRRLLIAYKETLIREKLNHTTIDRHLSTLRSFFRWLVDDGLLTHSPAAGVRLLNPKRLSSTLGFSDEEVVQILQIPDLRTAAGSMHYSILMVLFYCGLRRSELCGLRTSQIRSERNHKVLSFTGKGNAERMIVMVPAVWHALQHYFKMTGRDLKIDQPVFRPLRNNRTGELNKGLDPSMIFYIVTRNAKKAGIATRVSPHSCRATAISNARDHQAPDRAIQEFAGWASPDMITRYDKRRNAVEHSAAHSIAYGATAPVTLPIAEIATTRTDNESKPKPEYRDLGPAENTPAIPRP